VFDEFVFVFILGVSGVWGLGWYATLLVTLGIGACGE